MAKRKHLLFILNLFLVPSIFGCAGYGTSVHTHEKSDVYELHVPAYKLAVIIPKDGLIQKNSREVGGPECPQYFYFENDSQKLIISGWFDSEDNYPGVKKYWEDSIKRWSREGLSSPQDVSFSKIGNWDAIFYEIKDSKYKRSHVRANWLQAGIWIDLHVSITANSSSSETSSELISLLKKIVIKEY